MLKSAESKGIWIFAEHRNKKIQPVVFELLHKAHELNAGPDSYIATVFLGEASDHILHTLIARGSEKVFVINHSSFETGIIENYVQPLVYLMKKYHPEIFLIGSTTIGRSLAPLLSAKIYTGLTADCTQLEYDHTSHLLVQIRPALSGNIFAEIICPDHRPQMATVRTGVFSEMDAEPSRKGNVIYEHFEKAWLDPRIAIKEWVKQNNDLLSLYNADIIISGGRGLQNAKNFELIKEFANTLGAAIGASRPCVEAGWIHSGYQIGQSGNVVSPSVYIACGISGQIQHLVGMQSAKTIIAINNDKQAPIFNVADYGIVGDVFEIIPAMIDDIKNLNHLPTNV